MSNFLWLQHARLLRLSPSPRASSNSCPLSWWCHPTIFVVPFSSCLHSFPASGSFSMSQLFASGRWPSQSIGAFLPMNIQGWFPLINFLQFRLHKWLKEWIILFLFLFNLQKQKHLMRYIITVSLLTQRRQEMPVGALRLAVERTKKCYTVILGKSAWLWGYFTSSSLIRVWVLETIQYSNTGSLWQNDAFPAPSLAAEGPTFLSMLYYSRWLCLMLYHWELHIYWHLFLHVLGC